MNREQLTEHALHLLRDNEHYQADARQGAPLGNSVVGSLLSIQFKAPRQLTEAAVLAAIAQLDHEASKPAAEGEFITLRRTGQAPLRFTGELLADADGYRQYDKEQNRWHEIAVYRTTGGRYVVRIAYRTRWQGEGEHDYAAVCGNAAAVADELRGYEPTEFVAGFPAGDAYAERQARLLADLRLRYESLVSEVLQAEEFAEHID